MFTCKTQLDLCSAIFPLSQILTIVWFGIACTFLQKAKGNAHLGFLNIRTLSVHPEVSVSDLGQAFESIRSIRMKITSLAVSPFTNGTDICYFVDFIESYCAAVIDSQFILL